MTLVEKWLEHCKQAGHRPKTEGGKATFFMTTEQARIYCNACDWKATAEDFVDKPARD